MSNFESTLAKFGSTFQIKAVSSLLGDKNFLDQSIDLIKPEYFESESVQWIVENILTYFRNFKSVPTLDVFKVELDSVSNQVLRTSIIDKLKAVFVHQSDTDLEYHKNIFLDFCKNQEIKNAIINSVDLLEHGDYSRIKVIMDKALHAGSERNLGHNWKDDYNLRMTDQIRNVISTGFPCIDEIIDGGLGEGELGVVIAPSGGSKSWCLTAIGKAALKQGKNVIHYTLELGEKYVGLRYDTLFTHIEPNKIRNNVEEVRRVMEEMKGGLIIKYFPTKSINTMALSSHLQRLIQSGFVPDLLIVDYPDLMRSNERSDARYMELGQIYEELRGLAGEHKIPCWVASQSQRSSMQDEIISADKIAESFQKVMTADFIMSLSRLINDKLANTGRIHVIKNRFGKDGQTYSAKIDIEHGMFELYDENSTEGMMINRKVGEGNGIVRQHLSRKLEEFKGERGVIEDF